MSLKKLSDFLVMLTITLTAPVICRTIANFLKATDVSFIAIHFSGYNLSYSIVMTLCGLLLIALGSRINSWGIGAGLILAGGLTVLFSSFDFFSFIKNYQKVSLLIPALPRFLFFSSGLVALYFASFFTSHDYLKSWGIVLGVMVLLPFDVYAAITIFLRNSTVHTVLGKLLSYYYRETFNLLMIFAGILTIMLGTHLKKGPVSSGITLGAIFCLLFPVIEIILGNFH